MNRAQLLHGSKWHLLEELARKPQSTSQLAKRLGTSQANISQQLRQLELAGFVKRERTPNRRVHYLYEIADDAVHLTHLAPRTAKKQLLEDPYDTFLIGLLMHEHKIPLLTLLFARPELTERFHAIGVLDRDDPELFVIAESVDDIRREHANITVNTPDGEQRVVLWSHTVPEVEDGLQRKDPYFLKSLEEIALFYDPDGTLTRLRKQREEIQ